MWRFGRPLPYKTPPAEAIFDTLDVVDAARAPQDTSFLGFRYDEWEEANEKRFGIMVSDHWLISFGWSDGHAVDVDLERIE